MRRSGDEEEVARTAATARPGARRRCRDRPRSVMRGGFSAKAEHRSSLWRAADDGSSAIHFAGTGRVHLDAPRSPEFDTAGSPSGIAVRSPGRSRRSPQRSPAESPPAPASSTPITSFSTCLPDAGRTLGVSPNPSVTEDTPSVCTDVPPFHHRQRYLPPPTSPLPTDCKEHRQGATSALHSTPPAASLSRRPATDQLSIASRSSSPPGRGSGLRPASSTSGHRASRPRPWNRGSRLRSLATGAPRRSARRRGPGRYRGDRGRSRSATCAPSARAAAIENALPSRASPCWTWPLASTAIAASLTQVLDLRRHDHVDVLGTANDAPGVEGETTDHDEIDVRVGEAAQQLVEGGLAQSLRAEPVKRISLWLSAMPSARLTLIGRRASSWMRRTRSASFAAGPVEFGEGLVCHLTDASPCEGLFGAFGLFDLGDRGFDFGEGRVFLQGDAAAGAVDDHREAVADAELGAEFLLG